MIASTSKLIAQGLVLAAAIACFALKERDAGMILIGTVAGSVVPVAERRKEK